MTKKFLLSFIIVVAAFSVAFIGGGNQNLPRAYAAGECGDLDGFKVDNGDSGTFTYDLGPGSVTFTVDGPGGTVSFESTFGIDVLIVKGGPDANVITFDPEAFSGSGTTPINPSNGKYYGVSHYTICWDYELNGGKTANPSYNRDFTWRIDKSVTPDELHMFAGENGDFNYNVQVERFVDEYNFKVTGTITINNPSPWALNASISDNPTVGTAVLNCANPLPVPAGGQASCGYSITLGGKNNGTNHVTVTTDNAAVGGFSASADWDFGAANVTVTGHASVTVSDTLGGDLGTAWGGVTDFPYPINQSCSTNPDDYTDGKYDYTVPNTATIDQTGQNDSESVTVYCYAPVPSKDAHTRWTRGYDWDIEKSVDPNAHTMFIGGSADSAYEIVVTQYIDDNYEIWGTISVYNPHPTRDITVSVSDVLSGGTAVNLACGGSLNVGPGASEACGYTADPDSAADQTNTVTISTDTGYSDSASATADFSDTPDVVNGDPEVELSDPMLGILETVSSSTTVNDTYTFECGEDENYENGKYEYYKINTATITGPNTDESDSERVDVTCYKPSIDKTAETTYTKKYFWDIEKSGSETEFILSQGQVSPVVNYTVTVSVDHVDTVVEAGGSIFITNPNPDQDMTVDLSDPGVSLSCASPLTVPAGQTVECTWSVDPGDPPVDFNNTATITINGVDISDTEAVTFTLEETDECVTVTDTHFGSNVGGSVCADEGSKTFNYSVTFGPYTEPALCDEPFDYVNVAEFTTNDTGTTGSDDHTVTITVKCEVGCTLTPGYWKTHSQYGPAPYDDTWAQIGEDTLFFLSGQSYYNVLWTNPRGNAYYILAHAYIAAELNILNGASHGQIDAAFAEATGLFSTYTPAQVAAMKAKSPVRARFIYLAGILDAYNNGYAGPPHCSE